MNVKLHLASVFLFALGFQTSGFFVSGRTQTDSQLETSNRCAVVFYRPKVRFRGRVIHPSIYCNGNQLLRMVGGRYLAIRLTPGKYILNSTDEKSNLKLEAKAGDVCYVKLEMKPGMTKGYGRLVMVPPERGAIDVQDLQPLDSDNIIANDLVSSGTAELLGSLPTARRR